MVCHNFWKSGDSICYCFFLVIKTRKSKEKTSRTPKRSIFIIVLIIAILIPVWFLLEGMGNVIGTGIVINIAFGATGLFCQLMLFAPKVIPPLLRSLGFKVGLTPTSRRKKTIRRSGARHNSGLSSSSGFSSYRYTYDSTTDTYRHSSVYPTYTQSRSHNTNSIASLILTESKIQHKLSTVHSVNKFKHS